MVQAPPPRPSDTTDPHALWWESDRVPSIPLALRRAVEQFGDRVAVIDRTTSVTFRELDERSAEVAAGLVAAGVRPGDRVVVWVENRWLWPVLALGTWRAGGIVVPLNTRIKGIEAVTAIRSTEATALFVVPRLLGNDYVEMLLDHGGGPGSDRPFEGLEHLRTAIVVDGPAVGSLCTLEAFLETGRTVDRQELVRREEAIRPEDLCEVLFTSGTTGAPKGVVLGHEQVLHTYADWSGLARFSADDRFLLVGPYAHGGPGINGSLVTSLLRGFGTVVIDVFDPDDALDQMLRHGVTAMIGPPSLYSQLLSASAGGPIPRLRLALLGMATVPPELIARLRDEWAVDHVCNAYGATDAGVITMTRFEDPIDVVQHTSGRPLPDVAIRLVADDGTTVPKGERGEVLVRSHAVSVGYWQAPGRVVPAVDDEGWYHTGDIGEVDGAGNLRIVDRKQTFFIVNGFNVYPAEVEGLLLHHGGIAEAAVVPAPDPDAGQVGVAFVVPRPGGRPEPEEVIAWARRSMANYKAPRHVVVLEALPLGPTGKVDRRALAQRWTSRPLDGPDTDR